MRVQMRTGLSRLHQRLASTMLYVTHDQIEAMTLGDRIAVMNRGVIQQIAEPMQVYHRPANLFVAGFIGSPPMNRLSGSLIPNGNDLFFQQHGASGTTGIRLEPGKAAGLIASAAKEIVLGIRPEHVTHRIHAPDISQEWNFEAVVEVVEPSGPETHIYFTSGKSLVAARVPGGSLITVGQKVPLSIDMRQALFFDPKTEKLIA
jgi:multiple sugar transport system ATP-binding protein